MRLNTRWKHILYPRKGFANFLRGKKIKVGHLSVWIVATGLVQLVVTPGFVFERQSHSHKWYSGRNSRIEDLWLELNRIPKTNVVNTGAKNRVEKEEKTWLNRNAHSTLQHSRVLSNYARPVRQRRVQVAKENWNHIPRSKETLRGPHSF